MNMNMKLQQKSSAVKRVFVSIRAPLEKPIVNKPMEPKPPTQPARFIRKRQDTLRCHTPDQGGGKPTATVQLQKPSYRRSLSPFINPCVKEGCTQYFKPKDSESLLSITPIEKEDNLCLPYELLDRERTYKARSIRTTVRKLGRNVDLKKGNFSKKQIVSEPNLGSRRESENARGFASSGFVTCEQSTMMASRTPSPVLPPRNNRCHALSKNFKISKQNLVSEVQKQYRAKSHEREEDQIEAPWQSILKDLDNLMQIKDLSPHQNTFERSRVPVKLTRA